MAPEHERAILAPHEEQLYQALIRLLRVETEATLTFRAETTTSHSFAHCCGNPAGLDVVLDVAALEPVRDAEPVDNGVPAPLPEIPDSPNGSGGEVWMLNVESLEDWAETEVELDRLGKR